MKQLSCDQCRERWDELINKGTFEADPQFADVSAHLESCADCQETFDLLVAAKQELQQLPRPKVPMSLRANILNEIERSERQSAPWWQSLLISPQHLAWASGAIVTVFIVALLMRPEHQTQVMQTVPQGLSNRAQMEEHNSAPPESSVLSPKSNNNTTVKKALPEESHVIKQAKSSTTKPQRPSLVESGSEKKKKSHQIQTVPAPKPALDSNTAPSEHPKDQSLQRTEPQESAVPQAHGSAAPAGINSNLGTTEKTTGDAPEIPKPSSQESAIQSDSVNHPMMRGARGPEEQGGAAATFKSQSMYPIIHWSKTITSDYDVANAEIIVTLEDGLTFTDESHNKSQRTLWQGTLFRGKQIPLNIDLYRHSNQIAKIHLKMINTDTQKILLDKTFDVK